jgi:hypothetical protein
MTFKAILFTKEDCLPCTQTRDHLNTLLSFTPPYYDHIVVMQKENHTSLVVSYDLELFPTLLIVDDQGDELGKLIGGKAIRADLNGILYALRAVNS